MISRALLVNNARLFFYPQKVYTNPDGYGTISKCSTFFYPLKTDLQAYS